MWGWAWGNVPQVPSISRRLLEGILQALQEIPLVLGREELARVDSLGTKRINQHGFPCGLQHPTPRWPESAVPGPALHGPTYRAPTAACGSNAATTDHGRVRGPEGGA